MKNNKAHNPMSEYLIKLQLIINNTEFKNNTEALKYETPESKANGDAYVRAINKTDIFESYTYDPKHVYAMLEDAGYTDQQIFYYLENEQMIPQDIKNALMEEARDILIASYVEPNKYYLNLSGKPFEGDSTTDADTILYIPDKFYEIYIEDNAIERNQPVHEMPTKYQELFMNTTYYQEMLSENTDATYLKYIGSNSIDIAVSRSAKDGDILRINTDKLSTYDDVFGNITVSADIIHTFCKTYKASRDYIFYTLRGDFNDIFTNYDSFIRFLTLYFAIGSTLNELKRKSTSLIHVNNVTANDFFVLYGFPSVIMEGAGLIDFLKNFRLLLMDKGTNVVYRVKDLIGYEYTDIYTLILVKQQVFENGVPLYYIDNDGNKVVKQEIVFRRMGTTADNTSYFKYRDSDVTYTVDEITSGDPRWWNTPEVEDLLSNMNYTLSNSKYIQLSTHMSMTDIYFQTVILLRGLLDLRQETAFTMLNINYNINNTSKLSVFDAVLSLIVLMNWHMVDANGNNFKGDMYLANGVYNGYDICYDLVFNGMNHAIRYIQGMVYYKDQIVGLNVKELYRVNNLFQASTLVSAETSFVTNINNGNLTKIDVENGSPVLPLKYALPAYKISSFNWDLKTTKQSFYTNISSMTYLEPDIFLPMLNKVLNREGTNIGEVIMTDIKLIYDYLEDKLQATQTITEFRQVTDAFYNIFLVDPVRDWYDETEQNIDAVLMDEYQITVKELTSLKSFFKEDAEPEITIYYNSIEYPINLYNIMNYDILTYEINNVFPFNDTSFVDLFTEKILNYKSILLEASSISSTIKNNYQQIINDKVLLDISNSDDGPKTFESLLFRTNASLYKYLVTLKETPTNMVLLMRAIVKALESYTNTQLAGLDFTVSGQAEYIRILKEVITYFKSYMVEFTKDEFVFVIDGLFDNGGNSNMLKMFDEIAHTTYNVVPKESLTMYDVSHITTNQYLADNNIGTMYDDAIIQIKTTYQKILDSGYDIWYDDGKRITKTPFDISVDDVILGNLRKTNDNAYYIILNKDNIIDDNYYGNTK